MSSTEQPGDQQIGEPWHRLTVRMIWADLAMIVVAMAPAIIAIGLFNVEASGQMWPLIGLAVFGILGAILDMLRWIFTRFRVTPGYVELKTGIFLRQHRSIQRDRIRSVDVEAKLRHRLARMRIVNIGAGQQSAAGESALSLDALSLEEARALQDALLSDAVHGDTEAPREQATQREQEDSPSDIEDQGQPGTGEREPLLVFARFEPGWFIYNMFNIWAFVLALGLGWGAMWLLSSFGFDLYGFVVGLADWDSIGWLGTSLIAIAAAGVFGAVGLIVVYFTENWNLELARVPSRDGTMLRTRRGLFTTREINRDENRIRGAQISEPLMWRWMGAADTQVVTTGLDAWSTSEPTSILPRGPVQRAREVAGQVLGEPENPFAMPLVRHPFRALRRRLWWATVVTLGLGASLAWLAFTDVIALAAVWWALAFWPIGLLAAFAAYRSLGHTITDRYVITRSGLWSRSTTVLQRSAVSTIVIRESVLQRLLNLRTVSTMTAAGDGGYDTPDIERSKSLTFATQAAPGLLEPFLVAGDRAAGAVAGSEPK